VSRRVRPRVWFDAAMAGPLTALEVFGRIPGPKRMYAYEGGHRDIPPEAVDAATRFLRRTLRPA
jgi:hypothetical protein